VPHYQRPQSVQLSRSESAALAHANRIKPELGPARSTFHVHVSRLVSIAGVEEQSIRAAAEDRGHAESLLLPGGEDYPRSAGLCVEDTLPPTNPLKPRRQPCTSTNTE
jgi:hypothetical protein